MNTGDPLANRNNKRPNNSNENYHDDLQPDTTVEQVENENDFENFGNVETDPIENYGMKSRDCKYLDDCPLFQISSFKRI